MEPGIRGIGMESSERMVFVQLTLIKANDGRI